MRITTRLATAGESGYLSMPVLRHPAEHYINPDGSLNEDELRREFAHNPGILMSSNDNRATLSLTVDLLDRMKIAFHRRMQDDTGLREKSDGEKKTSAERRFDRGKYSYARVDIRSCMQGFRVKLSAEDPHEVVGNTGEFARIFAQAYADNLVAIADSLRDQYVAVIMTEGNGCAGIVAEAHRRNERQLAKGRHLECPNRKGGYCAPITPACELYCKGRCTFDDPL